MTDLERLVREIVRDELKRARAEVAAPDEYLSTAAAATLAGVHADTIRRWIREGKLAERRAGRVVRVLRADLERLLRDGARRSDDATPEELALRDYG